MLLVRERLAIALFFAILGALITIAWVTCDTVDPEIESKLFSEWEG